MITTDRDGLSPAKIARIKRLELARYRKPKKQNRTAPIIAFLFGIWIVISFALALVHNRWSPGTEIYTRLSANLDDQKPSITIYANEE